MQAKLLWMTYLYIYFLFPLQREPWGLETSWLQPSQRCLWQRSWRMLSSSRRRETPPTKMGTTRRLQWVITKQSSTSRWELGPFLGFLLWVCIAGNRHWLTRYPCLPSGDLTSVSGQYKSKYSPLSRCLWTLTTRSTLILNWSRNVSTPTSRVSRETPHLLFEFYCLFPWLSLHV